MPDTDGKRVYNEYEHMRSLAILTILIFLFITPQTSFALEGLARFGAKSDVVVFLETAVTEEEKSKGLMNRPSLAENRGMVFIFKPARKITFWMKNTLISLDMIFINRGHIVKIVKNAIPNQTTTVYPSDFDITEVIEVNGGFSDAHDIKAGDRVKFENISDIDYSTMSKLMILRN